MAGVSRLQYSTEIRIIRVMCTGRVDSSHLLRAFSRGADGVFVVGCRLGECNYSTGGNYHALNLVFMLRRLMEHLELSPERLGFELMSSSEGQRFAEFINGFVNKIKEIGAVGLAGRKEQNGLYLNLKAAELMIPYLRLVLGERLKIKFDTMEQYEEFYSSKKFETIFNELIIDKLAISQIMLLLQEGSPSTVEMSEILGLTPSEISRCLEDSSRQGLTRYEENQKRFVFTFA